MGLIVALYALVPLGQGGEANNAVSLFERTRSAIFDYWPMSFITLGMFIVFLIYSSPNRKSQNKRTIASVSGGAFVALLTLILPTLWLWRWRRNRRLPGHCPSCGYDLRASKGKCPECGKLIPEAKAGRSDASATLLIICSMQWELDSPARSVVLLLEWAAAESGERHRNVDLVPFDERKIAMSTRDEFVAMLKAKLDGWNAEIDELEAKARQKKAQPDQRYAERVAALKQKRDEANDKLNEIQGATGDAWENLKSFLPGLRRFDDLDQIPHTLALKAAFSGGVIDPRRELYPVLLGDHDERGRLVILCLRRAK